MVGHSAPKDLETWARKDPGAMISGKSRINSEETGNNSELLIVGNGVAEWLKRCGGGGGGWWVGGVMWWLSGACGGFGGKGRLRSVETKWTNSERGWPRAISLSL